MLGFAALAIAVSALGLFGLSSFTAGLATLLMAWLTVGAPVFAVQVAQAAGKFRCHRLEGLT